MPLVYKLSPPLIQVLPVFVQDSFAIHENGQFGVSAGFEDQSPAGHVGCAGADEGDTNIFQLLAHDPESVDEAGQRDGRRSLLIIVPDGDLAFIPQGIQDSEALGLGDVLQVYATERRLEHLDRLDELIGVLGIQHDRDGIHTAQVLVQQGFALHDRQAGLGANVAQPQHPRPIADDGHGVPLAGVLVYQVGFLDDGPTGRSHPRRVPDGEIVNRSHRTPESSLSLASIEGM